MAYEPRDRRWRIRISTDFIFIKRRLPNLIVPQNIQIHSPLRHHKLPPTARPAPIHPVQKLLHQPPISLNKPLHNSIIAAQLQLTAEIRQFAFRQSLCGDEGFGGRVVGRGDGEDGGDEGGVPLGDAVYGGAAPVVAAKDETGDVDLAGEGGDGVGVGEEAVILQIGRVALMLSTVVRIC